MQRVGMLELDLYIPMKKEGRERIIPVSDYEVSLNRLKESAIQARIGEDFLLTLPHPGILHESKLRAGREKDFQDLQRLLEDLPQLPLSLKQQIMEKEKSVLYSPIARR